MNRFVAWCGLACIVGAVAPFLLFLHLLPLLNRLKGDQLVYFDAWYAGVLGPWAASMGLVIGSILVGVGSVMRSEPNARGAFKAGLFAAVIGLLWAIVPIGAAIAMAAREPSSVQPPFELLAPYEPPATTPR